MLFLIIEWEVRLSSGRPSRPGPRDRTSWWGKYKTPDTVIGEFSLKIEFSLKESKSQRISEVQHGSNVKTNKNRKLSSNKETNKKLYKT